MDAPPNISLETLYARLDKHIRLVQAYTEIPNMAWIIKACRLKPYDYLFDKRNVRVKLYRSWIDEFGNAMCVKSHRRYFEKIVVEPLKQKIIQDKLISTDLYYGLAIEKVIKFSKLMYLSVGLDYNFKQSCYHLTLLGIDNYLRSYVYQGNGWEHASPLLLKMRGLRRLAHHRNDDRSFRYCDRKNIPIPCCYAMSWLTPLPLNRKFSRMFGGV